jgi:hypothetical protein
MHSSHVRPSGRREEVVGWSAWANIFQEVEGMSVLRLYPPMVRLLSNLTSASLDYGRRFQRAGSACMSPRMP